MLVLHFINQAYKSISNSYADEICHLLEFAKSLNLLPKENEVHLQVFGIFYLAFSNIVDPSVFVRESFIRGKFCRDYINRCCVEDGSQLA